MTNKEHNQEWLSSVVDRDLIALNVVSLKDFEGYDRLLYAIPQSDRRNDGRIRSKLLRRYAHIENGSWWVSGVDLLTGLDSIWGQLKPDTPYRYQEDSFKGFAPNSTAKNKIVKYEAPRGVATELIALRVPLSIWQAIASHYDIPLPENIVVNSDGRALGFWAWVIANPKIPIIITEGAKKAGCLITAEYVAIALPGIFNGYRQPKDEWGNKIGKPHLIPQIEILAQKNREFIFCFDNDVKPKTVKNVQIAIAKTSKLLEIAGCKVSTISWDYPEKGVDDLIVARGVDCFRELYRKRTPLTKFRLLKLLSLEKYKPLIINQRYLEENLTPPPDAQLIGLKSSKGTGKTERLAKMAQEAIRQGRRVIILCHREQLAITLANRFGVDYRTEIRTSVTKGALGYALCVDSLHKNANPSFNPEEWSEALVIIDEAEQVFWHMLESNTCQSNRINIIESFKELLNTVVETGGKIYLADADLSPIALDYVRSLIDTPVSTWVVENQYNPNKGIRKLISYTGNDPRELIANLVKKIKLGEKTLVHATGQKASSKWGAINLESYLAKKFPDLKILRIDSESVAEPGHPALGCMGNINAIVANYDIVICSPVLETGVSIDIKGHFDSVWAIAQGVQTVDAICQSIERLRDDVPRHIWIKKTAKGNRIGNGSVSLGGLLASQHKTTALNIKLLQQACVPDFDEFDVNFSPQSLNTWARRAVVVNSGKNNYRESIIGKLIDEGYELVDSEKKEDKKQFAIINEDLTQTRTENYDEYAKTVTTMTTPTPVELETLKNKRAKTKKERLTQRKGILARRYGVEVTPELVKKDDKGWYSKLRLNYFLTVGKIYLAERDRQLLDKMSKQGEGRVFKPDVNKHQLSSQIHALSCLNIEQFLDPEAEFSKESLQDWFDFAIKVSFDLKTLLGVSINPEKDSPIPVVQRILKKIGEKLEFKCWRGGRKNKHRVYKGSNQNSSPEIIQIFDFWNSINRDSDLVHTNS